MPSPLLTFTLSAARCTRDAAARSLRDSQTKKSPRHCTRAAQTFRSQQVRWGRPPMASPPPFALARFSAHPRRRLASNYMSCHATGSGGRAAGSQKLRILTVGERRWIAAPAARATPPIMGFARAQPRSLFFTGSTRMRLPVAAKIALHSAGATGGTGGSPTPPQKPPLGTITVSTGGASAMRSIS